MRSLVLVVAVTVSCSGSPLTPVPEDGGTRRDSGNNGIPLDSGFVAKDASVADADEADAEIVDAASPDAAADAGPADGGEVLPVPACTTDLTAELANLRVPGLSAGIIKHGRLVCTAVAGHADIESDRLITPDTVFAWASVSKTVTSVAAMILFEQGELALDDDIDLYLPFSVRNPNCAADPITFRQLLTHASSIIDNDEVYDESYTIGDSMIALGDFARDYFDPQGDYYDEDENFAGDCPGQSYEYSNIAVGLLGYLVEVISGVPFDQFCRDRIFTPLGMNETSFHLADLDVANIAIPYDGDSPQNFEPLGHIGFPTYPDGGLRTSVPHLARFLAMMAGLGEYDGRRIIEETTAVEMQRAQIPNLDETQGLIWFYATFGAHADLFGHDGSDPGTSSLMFFDPVDGAGVLLVANGDWYDENDESPEADALMQLLLDEAAGY